MADINEFPLFQAGCTVIPQVKELFLVK